MPDSDLLNGLEEVMRAAGDLARATAARGFRHWTKGEDRSPVSEADIAVNDLLRERLTRLVPAAGWLSEETEDAPDARAAAQVWVVDPIDGTRAFISGRPDWTISVALVADGRPVLAGLYAPLLEQMFLAEHGRGARLNGASMAVSAGGDLAGARVAGPKRYLDRLEKLTPAVLPQPKVHSLALRLTQVGSGVLDVAFSSGGSHDWDLAAADLLVHEAGGLVTDFAGHPLTFNGVDVVHGAVLAAGPAPHDALLALVRDRMPEFA
ncbi:MAG TPA: 3'(2'),5'-bisphosphate nucleotidase CysQ [Pseudolabrys sp.]|nr:3'(2'),5'-bisphosphate nucleotidase CysQ [Pseudolabrys sp.]